MPLRERERLIKELKQVVEAEEKIMLICEIVENWEKQKSMSKKEKQQKGIQKARESGVTFGRPRLREPENFPKICRRYFHGEISAVVAAEACGMGVSTFYRRVRDLVDEKEKRGEK